MQPINSKKASMFFQVTHTSLIFLLYFGQISFTARTSLDTMIFSTQRQPKKLTTQVIVVLFITTQRSCDRNWMRQNWICENDGMKRSFFGWMKLVDETSFWCKWIVLVKLKGKELLLEFSWCGIIWNVIPIGLTLDVRVATQTQIWPIQML